MNRTAAALAACLLVALASVQPGGRAAGADDKGKDETPVQLGNFSVSLTVKDIAASRAFYEKLGFRVRGGNQDQKWLVLQNGTATIGIFQGMFEKNSLTFNPGWDNNAKPLAEFTDVREIQRILKERGLTLDVSADENSTGTAYIVLHDPDGNPVLIDQHVPKPAK